MKPKSAGAKGKRFESFLLDYFRQGADANTYIPKGSGSGVEKCDLVIPQHTISAEVKNQKTIKLIEWWEKLKSQVFNDYPVLIIRNPRKAEFEDTLVVLSLEHFNELLQTSQGSVEVEPKLTYQQRSALNSMKIAASRILKEFPHE